MMLFFCILSLKPCLEPGIALCCSGSILMTRIFSSSVRRTVGDYQVTKNADVRVEYNRKREGMQGELGEAPSGKDVNIEVRLLPLEVSADSGNKFDLMVLSLILSTRTPILLAPSQE